MTDPIDRGCEREDELRADAIAEQRRRAGLEGKTAADSAKTCEACGGRIPAARRRAVPGVQTCVECQTLIERAGLTVY
ncbi:MAG: TraR/DksA C4-type zinc finger protein [Candidatus Accumulibacter sp.]|nr:TraR/DksA C4-type zinc finger protein [Accumulibacter sp.]